MDYLPIEKCEKGKIYKLNSRNLTRGVYNGNQGFIGIRNKFGYDYLDTETHWDTEYNGKPFGTAKPIQEIGVVPDWIELKESLGTICGNCGRNCIAIPISDSPTPVRWEHIPWEKYNPEIEEGEDFDFGDCETMPSALHNSYLFDFLNELRKEKC
jgi:hypothetical protein